MQDLNNLGLNQGTVSTVGCIITTLLGAYGQTSQIKKIWRNQKAEQVSGVLNIIMFTLFASCLVRGIVEMRTFYLIHGVLRTALCVPIILGIIRFGVFTKWNWTELLIGFLIILGMFVFDSFRIIGFSLVMYLGLIGAIHQAWSVRKLNGQVSFTFYLTMLASVSFQSWYGWHYNDIALMVPCLGFTILYIVTLVLMVRNLKSKNVVTFE
jgi:hypothetical protein